MLNIVENCISLHCCITPIIIRFTMSFIMMGFAAHLFSDPLIKVLRLLKKQTKIS